MRGKWPARSPLQESRYEKTRSNIVPGGMVRNGQRGTSQREKTSKVGERERNFKESTYMRRVLTSLRNTVHVGSERRGFTHLHRAMPYLSWSEAGTQCSDSTAPACPQSSVNIYR